MRESQKGISKNVIFLCKTLYRTRATEKSGNIQSRLTLYDFHMFGSLKDDLFKQRYENTRKAKMQ